MRMATSFRPSFRSLLSVARLAPCAAPTLTLGITASILAPMAPCAAREAFAAPASSSRALDFTASELRLFKDPESGEHFWFFTYEVVNNTGADQRFAPRIEMLSDEGHVIRQGDGVPGRVTKEIKSFLKNPLLEDQFEILGEVLQGKEHARTGLVVFRAPDLDDADMKTEPRVNADQNLDHTELSVLVQGLSRETEKKVDPKTGATVTLRKTMKLDYQIPGDPSTSGTVVYPIETSGWIFR
jgi:hypothetical protein